MKKTLFITTGGTIAGHSIKTQEKSHLEGIDFVKNLRFDNVDEISKNLTILNLYDVDSTEVTAENWKKLINCIYENYSDYDSFVITHGTNTMSCTSCILAYAFENLGKPIILVGAQLPFQIPETDAVPNMVRALRLAMQEEVELKGIFVTMGQTVINGTRAKKTDDEDLDPFKSFGKSSAIASYRTFGIDFNMDTLAKNNSYYGNAKTKEELKVYTDFSARVISYTYFVGMMPEDLKNAIDLGYKGIVIRGVGSGDIPRSFIPILQECDKREVPVIITTQAPNGYASMETNMPGLEISKQTNIIPAYDMSIDNITYKLVFALSNNMPYSQIKDFMLTNIRGEIQLPSYIGRVHL